MKTIFLLTLFLGLIGCGIKGPPLPPVQENNIPEKKIEVAPTPVPTPASTPAVKKKKNK